MNRYLFAVAPRCGGEFLNSNSSSFFSVATTSWSAPGRTVDDDSKQVSFFGLTACFFFFFQRTKLIHTSRRSTPTTFVSQTTTGSSAILFFRIICVCVYLKVTYTTGTIYFRGFLVAFHFCLKGTFLFTVCIIALIHFTLLKAWLFCINCFFFSVYFEVQVVITS